MTRRDHNRAERAHRRGFRRRRDAGDDRAEHRADQADRRGDHLQQLARRARRARAARALRPGWPERLRPDDAQDEDVDAVDAGQHQAGDHRRREQRADRLVHDVGQQDQDQARRNDLTQRAGRADHAAGQTLVVAAPQHTGERQQTERHHRGADDARSRAHQHADQDDPDAEPPAQRPSQMTDHVHQILGQPRSFQHHPHEHEQGDRKQRRIGHDAKQAVRQQVEKQRTEAEIAEHEAGDRQRQRDRDAGQQQDKKRNQHQNGKDFIRKHQALRIAI